MPELRRTPLSRLRLRVLLHRRLLAACCAALAVAAALRALSAPPPATQSVWVAAHDLAGGAVVRPEDLRAAAYRPGSAPAGAISAPGIVLGRPVAHPMRSGEPWTDLSVTGSRQRAAYAGMRALPVRLDPDVAALLRPGDRIDLVAVDAESPGEGHLVASGAVVIAIPARDPAAAPIPDISRGRVVVLAVADAEAMSASVAGATGVLTAYWSR